MKTMPSELKSIRPDTTVEWNPQVLDDWCLQNGASQEYVSETIGKNKLYLYQCAQKRRIGRDALIALQDLTGIPKSFFMGNKPAEDHKDDQTFEEHVQEAFKQPEEKKELRGYALFESLLKEKSLNARRFCQAVRIDDNWVSAWKTGRTKNPTKKRVKLLADFFGVPMERFYVRDEEPVPVRVYTAPASLFDLPEQEKPEEKDNVPEVSISCHQVAHTVSLECPQTVQTNPSKIPDGWMILMGLDANYFVKVDEIVQVRKLMNGTQVITKHGTFSVLDDAWNIMEMMAG